MSLDLKFYSSFHNFHKTNRSLLYIWKKKINFTQLHSVRKYGHGLYILTDMTRITVIVLMNIYWMFNYVF